MRLPAAFSLHTKDAALQKLIVREVVNGPWWLVFPWAFQVEEDEMAAVLRWLNAPRGGRVASHLPVGRIGDCVISTGLADGD